MCQTVWAQFLDRKAWLYWLVSRAFNQGKKEFELSRDMYNCSVSRICELWDFKAVGKVNIHGKICYNGWLLISLWLYYSFDLSYRDYDKLSKIMSELHKIHSHQNQYKYDVVYCQTSVAYSCIRLKTEWCNKIYNIHHMNILEPQKYVKYKLPAQDFSSFLFLQKWNSLLWMHILNYQQSRPL